MITISYGSGRQQSKVKHFCSNAVSALRRFLVTDVRHTPDQITRGRRSKRAWSDCVLCIPFILSGSPNKCWLHTCDACVITTWRFWIAGSCCRLQLLCTYFSVLSCWLFICCRDQRGLLDRKAPRAQQWVCIIITFSKRTNKWWIGDIDVQRITIGNQTIQWL